MSKLPHSTQNNRLSKALMIEKFISKKSKTKTLKLLEIGTGTGLIASYFANQSNYKYEVHSLDVVDNCISKININFQMIKDTQLPFPDMEFDFIISNHVIEHVGDVNAQHNHLNEIYRVLKTDGEAYLACPNKFMIIEPHYQLYFLSWLPRIISNFYIRALKRNSYYDCFPPSLNQLNHLIQRNNLKFNHIEDQVIISLLKIENSSLKKIITLSASFFAYIVPTFVCILRK